MPDGLPYLTIARDGTVLSADNCPAGWAGTDLTERSDTPADLKSAIRQMLDDLSAPAPLVRDVVVAPLARTFRVVVVEALPIRRVPVDLRELLESSLTPLRRQAAHSDVTIRSSTAADFPRRLLIDGEKVAWLVTVLVGNALRYVPHGSDVMPGGTIIVKASYDAAARQVSIAVQDDGPGIPADTKAALFQTGPTQPRVGLGLVMVFDVVVAHGGRLDVESGHEGTVVRIALPVT
jgi:signal transduction histidine kinase